MKLGTGPELNQIWKQRNNRDHKPMIPLFAYKQAITDPVVIDVTTHAGSQELSFESRQLKGDYYLVRSSTAKEVFALQMLEHRVEKFAHKDSGAIVLTKTAVEKFQ